MIKFIHIRNSKGKDFLLAAGTISDGMDLVIPFNMVFDALVGDIKDVEVHHGYAEEISLELLNNAKVFYHGYNDSDSIVDLKKDSDSLKLISDTVNMGKGFLLLKNEKSFSEKKVETEYFPYKKRIYLYGENEKKFTQILKYYNKNRIACDKKQDNDFKTMLENFKNAFYAKTLFRFFSDKDVKIYEDKEKEVFVFDFPQGSMIKNKDIKNSVKNLEYNDTIMKDEYTSVFFGKKNGTCIRKGRKLTDITKESNKKHSYSVNEFVEDMGSLDISLSSKMNYFYKVFLENKKDELGKQLHGDIQKVIKENKSGWSSYFYSAKSVSHNYIKKETKTKDVSDYLKESFLHVPLIECIKGIRKGGEHRYDTVLQKYGDYLKNEFEELGNGSMNTFIDANMLELLKAKEYVLRFAKKYVPEDDEDISTVRNNMKEIIEGLRIKYHDIVAKNELSQRDIEKLHTYITNQG